MAYGSIPDSTQWIDQDGLGPSWGIGMNTNCPLLVQHEMMGAIPSVQEIHVFQAPTWAYGVGSDEFAYPIQPYQGGHPDEYSWRVKAPPIPLGFTWDEISYQIFHNSQVVAHGLILTAPSIPTGGLGSCTTLRGR
jgi:hypothetical protein